MNKQKKILIVTDCFPPNFAPRMGLLSANLEKLGYDITIISEDNCEKHYNLPNLPKKVYSHNYQSNLSKTKYYIKSFLNLIYDHKSKSFYKKYYNSIKDEKFDLVLCSTFNEFPLGLAYKISSKLQIPLVCDIRDIAEQFGNNIYSFSKRNKLESLFTDLLRKRRLKRRNFVLQNANAITTISPWHKEFLSKFNKNVHLIYNGFSKDDFSFNESKSDTFDIIYTGRILDTNTRNPELLFNAIEELSLDKIRLVWYMDAKSKCIINETLQPYPKSQKLSVFMDLVSINEIPTLLQQSSIVLVLTNKSGENGPKGIMTTKFFEAVGVEKPVLCVRSDEGCLAQVISETNAGLAAKTTEEVKDFITEKYSEWQKNGFTRQDIINKEYFCRENQAKQFVEIFNNLVK